VLLGQANTIVMNRLHLRLSHTPVIAILLFLVFSPVVFAQCASPIPAGDVCYTVTATLDLVSGHDLGMLAGETVTAIATLSQTAMPTSTTTTSTSSVNVYSNVPVLVKTSSLGNVPCTSSVTLTDNVPGPSAAPDSIEIACSFTGITLTATANLPSAGYLITAVPAEVATTAVTGTVFYYLGGGGTGTTLDFAPGATLVGVGPTPPPSVTPSPIAWTPSAVLGSTTSLSQPVTFTTSVAGAADSFTTSTSTTSGGNWLSVTPAAANTTSTPFTISANPSGLGAGVYNGTVSLNYGNSGLASTSIPVTFTILTQLNGPASMTFNYTIGTTAPGTQQLNITTTPAGSASVSAAVTSGSGWLSVTPSGGTTPASFTVSVNPSGLTAQTYNGNIQITAAGATNSPFNVPVSLMVTGSTLTVPSATLTFNYVIGGSIPGSQSVNVSGTSGVNFTTSTGAASSWLSATPSGTVPSSISVSLNPAGLSALSAGPHSGTVTVTSAGVTGSPAGFQVTLNVSAPSLTATPSQLNFSYQYGSGTQPASQPINVGDPSSVSYTATAATNSGGSWLSVSPASGTASGSPNVSVNAATLAPGTYTGTITVAATGATSQVVNVTLVVAQVTVSSTSLEFAYQLGSGVPAAQTVTIGGTPGLSITAVPATTSGGSWLSATPSAPGTIPGSVSISVSTTGLTANTYNGTVTISAPGAASQVVNVTLVVSNMPTISASPSSLTFNYTLGGTAPVAQMVTVGGSSGLAITASAATNPSGGSWLSATPVSPATTPGSVSVSVNITSLTANTYTGTVTISAPGATSQTVNVTLVVSSTVTATPSPLSFNYTLGSTTQPAAQQITIGGTATSFTATAATVPSGGSWLSVTPSGTIPGSASVSVNTTGLTANTYNGTITISAPGAVSSVVVNVSLVVSPTVTATPSSLSFTYALGSTTQPAAQPITIGGTATSFTATAATTPSGGTWLSVTPSGSAPGSASVSVNTSGLAANTYNGTITIAAPGAVSQTVKVTLVVTSTVTAAPSSLSFSYTLGSATQPAAQQITIGGTAAGFTASVATTPSGGSWLSVTPSGAVPGIASVSVNTAGLTANTYSGTITVAGPGATSQTVSVTLVVAGNLTAAPSSLTFNYSIGGTAPAAQSIAIGGTTGLAFTATAATNPTGGTWLSVTPSGTVSGTSSVSVSANITGLAANTYTGTITIAAPGVTSQTVTVTLVVASATALTANPAALTFAYQAGGTAPAAQTISITGASGATFTATVAAGAPWLSAALVGAGTSPGSVSVSIITTGLTTQTYHGTITITSSGASNSPLSIPVALTVNNVMTLSTSALNFTAIAGGAAPADQTVNVTTTVPGPVSITYGGGAWLSAGVNPAITPAAITVAANPSGLKPGIYIGSITVTSPGAYNIPQTILITFTVSTGISASPGSFNFAYTIGGANPAPTSINVTSSEPVTISSTAQGGTWLTASSSGSSTPATVTVAINASGLSFGTYKATINIVSAAASNSPLAIPVTLVVSTPSPFSLSPSSLTFITQAGAANPASQSINLTSSSPETFGVTSSPGWLTVTTASYKSPATLVATVNTKGMTAGSYQGLITVTPSPLGSASNVIPVTLNIASAQVVTGPSISAVVNGASFDTSGFSPGAIVSIFGSFLGPQTGASFALTSKGSLGTTLGGATVTVGGMPAIPLFVQNGQINVILPFNLNTTGEAGVTVTYNNLTSPSFNIPLVPADVQIFTANASGSGPGSILNQDYSDNTAANPAAPGSVVAVYGTGGGMVSPAVAAGDIAGDTLSWVSSQYSALVNGENATVVYAGTAPGLLNGVYQFNVQLPADLPPGPATLVLLVGASTSQPDVTVFVK
jgi:uncharacterized protein (TIGR03437 family)